MSELKRYDPRNPEMYCYGESLMEESPTGLYVLYDKAKARIAELEALCENHQRIANEAQSALFQAGVRIAELEAAKHGGWCHMCACLGAPNEPCKSCESYTTPSNFMPMQERSGQ